MEFHHVGVPSAKKRPNETYLADAKLYVTDAAARGAEATRNMQARFGKARNLGERSKGTVDPGATSISCMFKGFADAVAARSSD